MDALSKKLHYSSLFAIYHELLSDTQNTVLDEYYNYDLSLSEIAEDKSISRAAVDDALKKGEAKLDELENKLHLLEKYDKLLKKCAELKDFAVSMKDLTNIEEIERIIKNGI